MDAGVRCRRGQQVLSKVAWMPMCAGVKQRLHLEDTKRVCKQEYLNEPIYTWMTQVLIGLNFTILAPAAPLVLLLLLISINEIDRWTIYIYGKCQYLLHRTGLCCCPPVEQVQARCTAYMAMISTASCHTSTAYT